jgi:hypothetical protein
LLLAEEVLMHPFVGGEIACGSLGTRREIQRLLGHLPRAALAKYGDVLTLIEREKLYALGIGWIGAHLIVNATLCRSLIWSLDRRPQAIAHRLKVDYSLLTVCVGVRVR